MGRPSVPTFLFGLPLHVLVVHAVVVLVPLAVLGAVLIAVWPTARHRYGLLVLGLAVVATALIPIATSAGEGLEHVLPRSAAMEAHTSLGDTLLPVAAAMLVAVAGLVGVERYAGRAQDRRRAAEPAAGRTATAVAVRTWVRPTVLVLSALTVVLAAVTAVQVVRIGDSGARAAWGDTEYVQEIPGHSPST
jgi:hypothetical protein